MLKENQLLIPLQLRTPDVFSRNMVLRTVLLTFWIGLIFKGQGCRNQQSNIYMTCSVILVLDEVSKTVPVVSLRSIGKITFSWNN